MSIVNDKKVVKGGENNMDNYNEVVGFNKERELENRHNGKNIEDVCYEELRDFIANKRKENEN